MAWIYAFGLLLLGFAVILIDVLVTPGMDFLAVLGLLSVAAGVVYAYRELGPTAALVVGGAGVVGTAVLLRLLIRSGAWERLVLSSDVSRARGHDSSLPGHEALLGQRGSAVSALRPSGRAVFGERVVDVVSEGGFVGPGESVQVVQVAGNRVVVQSLSDAPSQGQQESAPPERT